MGSIWRWPAVWRRMILQIRTATLDDPEQGLTNEILDSTDVLMWWGHAAHDEVTDDNVMVNKLRKCKTTGGFEDENLYFC